MIKCYYFLERYEEKERGREREIVALLFVCCLFVCCCFFFFVVFFFVFFLLLFFFGGGGCISILIAHFSRKCICIFVHIPHGIDLRVWHFLVVFSCAW